MKGIFNKLLELLAFCLLIPDFSLVKSVLAGILFGGAVLSTPRAHPLALCFFPVFLCYAIIRKNTSLLRSVCLTAATALLTVTTWTLYAGVNPVSWYMMLLRASAGDKTNASPLLGGLWGHFSLDLPSLVMPVGLSIWLILWAIRRREKRPLGLSGVLFTVLLANAAVYLAVTSRALSYQIFWLVPLVPVAVALTETYVGGDNPRWPSMAYLLVITTLIAGVLRIGKITEVVASWTARDPQPLANFVCNKVPQNSTVFGPTGPYYYAVEECGSQYLYAGKWTASGIQSPLDPPNPAYRAGDFLLWPADLPLPKTGELQETARFRTQVDDAPGHSSFAKFVKRKFPFTGGYPESVLYQMK